MKPPPTRQRILLSARTLFEAGGLESVSLRRIAADIGLTPMAIYRHFEDKDALLDALVLDGLDRWRERVEGVQLSEPLQWLEAVGEEFLAFALEEPRRFEAAFLVPAKAARRYPDDFAAGRSPAGRLWIARLETLQREGRLAPDAQPVEAGFTLWALGQGLITLYRADRFFGGADAFRAFYRQSMRRCLSSFVDVDGRP
jgi:AcrR family transcriptional regulator